MQNQPKFIGVKDLILSVLLSLLAMAISAVVVIPLGTLDILTSSLLAGSLPALICGVIYVLMMTKSPRIGTTFIFSFIFGLFFLVSGSLITAIMFFITGIIGEFSLIGGWGKTWRPIIPYLLHWMTYTYAATLQFIFMRDSILKTYIGMGMDEATAAATIDTYSTVYTAPQNMILSGIIIGIAALAGYYIGTKVLGKHFRAAGIV